MHRENQLQNCSFFAKIGSQQSADNSRMGGPIFKIIFTLNQGLHIRYHHSGRLTNHLKQTRSAGLLAKSKRSLHSGTKLPKQDA